MCPRNLVCITLLAVCHLRLGAQAAPVLTNPYFLAKVRQARRERAAALAAAGYRAHATTIQPGA